MSLWHLFIAWLLYKLLPDHLATYNCEEEFASAWSAAARSCFARVLRLPRVAEGDEQLKQVVDEEGRYLCDRCRQAWRKESNRD